LQEEEEEEEEEERKKLREVEAELILDYVQRGHLTRATPTAKKKKRAERPERRVIMNLLNDLLDEICSTDNDVVACLRSRIPFALSPTLERLDLQCKPKPSAYLIRC